MKRFEFQRAGLLLFLLLVSACGGRSEFVGKWRNVNAGKDGKLMVIEQQDNSFALYPEGIKDQNMLFTYDAVNDRLFFGRYDDTISIRFNKKSGQLLLESKNNWMEKMQFEKEK